MTLASETVRDLLAAKIESLGYAVKQFRDDDDAITAEELPCVLLQQSGLVVIQYLEGMAGGIAQHNAPFLMSFVATTRDAAAAMLRATANALAADYNLGGQIGEILPLSYGDEEADGRDYRAILFEIAARFYTDPADIGTLVT